MDGESSEAHEDEDGEEDSVIAMAPRQARG
jgi:hypothetical protein